MKIKEIDDIPSTSKNAELIEALNEMPKGKGLHITDTNIFKIRSAIIANFGTGKFSVKKGKDESECYVYHMNKMEKTNE